MKVHTKDEKTTFNASSKIKIFILIMAWTVVMTTYLTRFDKLVLFHA